MNNPMKRMVSVSVALAVSVAALPIATFSEEQLSLDGEWRFSFEGGEERMMPVPSCWELHGVGTLRYKDADAPESGRYERTFAIPSDWPADDLVILRFDGVMFGANVTVNGKNAGTFRSSFNRNELDITALVSRDAENTLIVETLKNPKGWGFDCNDDWILHGIFRDVTLISRPPLNVADLSLSCKVDAASSSAEVEISAAASDGGSAVRLKLIDADGKIVLEGDSPLKGVVENARLWTCETPNLYTLVAEAGRDRVEKRVGLREITRDGAILKLNGRPIKLHGVNHHDLCPCHGRAITIDELRRDVELIKEGNFNCVRLAHYPPNEAFLDMCDELGIYAIDEVPFGMGTKNLREASYLEVLEERARLTVSRDKLHPSVIAWTVGNENPLTDICMKCGDMVAKLDPTRPTCYPQYSSVYQKMLDDGAPPSAMLYDFHYVDAAKIRELAPRLDRPLFAGEFAHALGLDFGTLAETWEEMWVRPECAGGCIWMFQDQGIARPATDVKEEDRKWLAWADEKTVWDTHGIDGCDGIVYPDRTPQVDYFAARAVFAPVKIEYDGKETLTFENRYDFTNLSETKISWSVVGQAHVGCVPLCCESSIGEGKVEVAVAPHEKTAFKIELPAIPDDVRIATLSVMAKGKGGEIVAAKAWPLKVDVKATPNGALPPLVFEPRWDRREMMSKWAAHLPKKNKKKYSILEKPAGFTADVKEESRDDGSLHVAYAVSATQEWHTIEAGLSFTLPEEFTTVRWVGQGPFEAYTLSNAQSMFRWFALDKDDLYFPGNRCDVRWLAALRDDGTGVVLIPDGGTGDVAFENVGGRIRVSHNAVLADKFNKYEWPRDVKAFGAGEKLCGGFTLMPVKRDRALVETPFCPFFKSYDDGGAAILPMKQSPQQLAVAKFIGAGAENGANSAYVRKEVVNEKAVSKSVWRVTGLGVFTPIVNMKRASSSPDEVEILMPGYTHFKKRRHEIALDVTDKWNCANGATNILSAIVTSGWWCDGIAGKSGGTWPAFRGVLTLTHDDGTATEIPTDESWIVTTDTPVVKAGIWEGESYDATKSVITDAAHWEAAKVSDEFKGEVSPRIGPPVAMRSDLILCNSFEDGKPVPFCGRIKPGETNVVDFGQNCAAVPDMQFSAEPGTRVTVRLGEMLNDGVKGHHGDGPKGSVYLANMRGASATFEYVCKGGVRPDGTMEHYHPMHTFYGYRYAAISADKPLLFTIASVPVSSISKEMERGEIETGDERVNRLVKNAYWSMLSNYLSVPTDCPQRTERLGWTGDTQVFAKTGCYFADVRGFFAKWMQDVRDTQHADGVVPYVVPVGVFGDNGPMAGWSDAAVIVPWTLWRQLGDAEVVRQNWDVMERYMARIASDGYVAKRGNWLLCDWLSFEKLSVDQAKRWSNGGYTDEHLSYQNFLNACHLYGDALKMAELAAALSLVQAMDYADLARRTKERILSTWFRQDGTLCGLFDGMQTPALFALKLGLGNREKIAGALVAAIHANGDRLATGFLGTPLICEVLSEIGESSLAYTLLLQREFPSWLYSVDQGATTIWERWNGYTKEEGFGDVRMNSFNHYAYGAVAGWLFEHAAGIKPDALHGGWRHFTLAPEPDKRLGRLRARYMTEFGAIESEWEYGDDGVCRWRFVVPEGTEAAVRLPDGSEFTATPGEHERILPTTFVTYTFDDGLRDQYTIAYPMFKELGLPATFFVIGSKVGDPDGLRSKAENGTPLMTWDEIREMSANGMEIASHGWSHAKYSRMTHDEILDDMIRNQRALKEFADVDCVSFAAPYNTKTAADGSDVASIAREAGIKEMRKRQTAAGGKMTAERMNEIVDGVRRKGGGRIVFMIHGMARGYDAWENPDELRRHLEWVKALPDVRVLRHSPSHR